MNDLDNAKRVLEMARKEILRELALCGQNGGVGRSQNYAPVLINLHKSIQIIEELQDAETKAEDKKADFAERMKAAREAKAAIK